MADIELVIKISEEMWERIKDGYVPLGISKYLKNGTPIPDNATNGDMQISLYPNLKYTIQNGRVVTTIGVASSFDVDWWNAPYQKGGKE